MTGEARGSAISALLGVGPIAGVSLEQLKVMSAIERSRTAALGLSTGGASRHHNVGACSGVLSRQIEHAGLLSPGRSITRACSIIVAAHSNGWTGGGGADALIDTGGDVTVVDAFACPGLKLDAPDARWTGLKTPLASHVLG